MRRTDIVFLKVAEIGNLTAASRALNIAQPSVTRMIGKLEEEFGAALFNRLPRGMELTAAGHALRARLEEVSAVYDRARKDVEAVRSGYYETVRIGVSVMFQTAFLPPLIAALRARFPNTSLDIRTGASESHVAAVKAGDLDIALAAVIPEFNHPSLDTVVIGSITHGVLFWPGTLPEIDPAECIDISALQDFDWVMMLGPRLTEHLSQFFFKLGFRPPRIAMTTNSFQVSLDMVRHQGMISSAPLSISDRLRERGYRLHRTSIPLWQVASGLAMLHANRGHVVLEAIVEEVRRLAEDLAR